MAIDSIIAEKLMQHLLMCDVGEMDPLKSVYCNLCVVWYVWYNNYARYLPLSGEIVRYAWRMTKLNAKNCRI